MQKVDEEVLERLIDRFFELDPDKSGSLSIGVEIPGKDQVTEMKAMIEGTGMTLQEAWKKYLSNSYRFRAGVVSPVDVVEEDEVVKESELSQLVGPSADASEPKNLGSLGADGVSEDVTNKDLEATESLSTPPALSTLDGRVSNRIKLSKVHCLETSK
jgi:hypothetical protein